MSSVANKLPEGWVKTTLGEVVETNKNTISKDYKFTEIQYLDTGSITEGKIEGFQKFKLIEAPSRAKRLVNESDIVYSTVRPNQKHFGFIQNPLDNLVVSTGFAVITSNEKSFSKFIYYLITQNKVTFYLHQLAEQSASAYPSIKPIDIENLKIDLPKIQEQKAIAKVLTAFDDKIENLQAQNKTLEQTAQTIFKEWFGLYQVGDALPDGFTEVTLKYIIDTANTGLDAIKRAPIVEEYTGLKCFRIQDASQKKNFKDWGNTKVEEKNFKKFQLLKGDILIARTGNSIGVNYLVKENLQSVFNNGLIRLRTNSKSNYQFLNMIITSKIFERHIQSIAYGTSTQPNMQINSLLSYEFVLPSDIKQKEFKEFLNPIIEKQKINQDQIQTLTKTRDTLLPKLMSGELRVNEFKS